MPIAFTSANATKPAFEFSMPDDGPLLAPYTAKLPMDSTETALRITSSHHYAIQHGASAAATSHPTQPRRVPNQQLAMSQ